ncbi:MarR family transcriptional regulator [Nonomuraea deserti]|uniref:MarR family transcriptional regulator n=1 Tax=Nonomuraea deserti TaxID=1848322 RepID=A0A4R4W5B7_9ACTN|nr:IclR family transcriptional regulator C-terminal domain-containing protein [Nonomuraea deserti]TDD10245.1 MarR family transcriptional regulator [Nonomuraea deserti]
MTVDHGSGPENNVLTSLERGLAVLLSFELDRSPLTLSEVARATGLDRSGARRLLHSLVLRGYVRTERAAYALHPRVLEIGNAYLASLALPEIAQPHFAEVSRLLDESVSMAVLDGDEIVYVARVPVGRLMSLTLSVGSRLPAYPTALGRVLLSARPEDWLDRYLTSASFAPYTALTVTDRSRLRRELARIRRQGWAVVDQELEVGLLSLAVPIRDASGATVAAINVSSHTSRFTSAELVDAGLRTLRLASERIESVLHMERPRGA